MMDTPRLASSLISVWISFFAPTSIPLVGSSRMSTRGSVERHFASATFCWFPPLRFMTSCPVTAS